MRACGQIFIYSFDWLTFLKENQDIEWAFSRTQMWLKYLDNRGTALPPPLNILEIFVACLFKILGLLYKKWRRRRELARRVIKGAALP